MKTLLPLLSLLALPATAQKAQRPNVLFIIADDLGYGDVSAYGQTSIQTPNIDRLARGGVSFVDGHATSATSTPSRYGLFTGLYPWRIDARILPGDAPLLIPEEQFTMPRMFQQAGYQTAAIGKWHLGMGYGHIDWNKQITPAANAVGFDYTNIIAATVDRVPTVYVENGRVVGLAPSDPIFVDYEKPFDGEPTALTNPELVKMKWSHGHHDTVVNGIPRIGFMKGGHSAYWDDATMAQYFLDRVGDFLDQQTSSQPFFLYYGLHEPHVPRTPMTSFAGTTPLGPRGDVVVEADWCVGEAMRMLEERGLLENTIVIFTSDNGPVLDDGYDDGARESAPLHDPNGGLRGGKYSLFEAGTRVPLFIYWKGHIKPLESHALVSQHDLVASFAKMLGQKVPDGLDSQEMLSTFLGKSMKGRKDMIVEAQGRLAYRNKRYALIPPYNGKNTNETGIDLGVMDHYALYDITADPAQQCDISAENPKLVEKLRRRFLALAGENYKETVVVDPLK